MGIFIFLQILQWIYIYIHIYLLYTPFYLHLTSYIFMCLLYIYLSIYLSIYLNRFIVNWNISLFIFFNLAWPAWSWVELPNLLVPHGGDHAQEHRHRHLQAQGPGRAPADCRQNLDRRWHQNPGRRTNRGTETSQNLCWSHKR